MSEYLELLKRINAGPRERAGCTPPACEAWKETDENGRLLINAILGMEVRLERKVGPADEAAVIEHREVLRAGMKAV